MTGLLDEILSNDTILLNDALQMLRKELDEMDYFSQQEIKEDLHYAFESEL